MTVNPAGASPPPKFSKEKPSSTGRYFNEAETSLSTGVVTTGVVATGSVIVVVTACVVVVGVDSVVSP